MRHSVKAAALAGLWATATNAQQEDIQCVDGLYIVIARGTNEEPGTGAVGLVAERLIDRIEGSGVYPINYPATFVDPFHAQSIKNGSEAARKAISDYAEKCPDGKMALFGYSQGAQVMGNAICGDRSGWLNGTVLDDNPLFQNLLGPQEEHLQFEDDAGVNKDLVAGKIVSLVLFGDPTFGANTTFAAGTATSDGLWPRDWAACDDYGYLMKSYCDEGDIICDASSEYRDGVHVQYLEGYGEQAVEFVLERWNEATGASVEVDGGGPFPDLGLADAPTGNSSTPIPTAPGTTGPPTSTESTESEPTSTAAATGLKAAGSIFIGGPLALVAAWLAL